MSKSKAVGIKAGVHKGVALCLDWPTTTQELEKVVGSEAKQLTDTHDTLRFSSKADVFRLVFTDGVGVTHSVSIDKDSEPVSMLVPVPWKVSSSFFTSDHKVIKWMYSGNSLKTHLPVKCTFALCAFAYEPSSMFHKAGIHVNVVSYHFPNQGDPSAEESFWGHLQREFLEGRKAALKAEEPQLQKDLQKAIQANDKQMLAVAVSGAAQARSISSNEDFIKTYYHAIAAYRVLLKKEQTEFPPRYAKEWEGDYWTCYSCNISQPKGVQVCKMCNCGHRPMTEDEWHKKVHERDWDTLSVGAIDAHIEKCARKGGWRPDRLDTAMEKYLKDEEWYRAGWGRHPGC